MLDQLPQFGNCFLAITILPNASCGEIQAASPVGREVVNKRFIRQLFNDKRLPASSG